MMKVIFIHAVFFCLFFFFSCNNFIQETFGNTFDNSPEENIMFSLPEWPPDDSCKELYPELDSWVIIIESASYSDKILYNPENNSYKTSSEKQNIKIIDSRIDLKVKKNKPLSVTAQPLTKTDKTSDKILFFKPAGFIYPSDMQSYYFKKNKNYEYSNQYIYPLTWNSGFSATVMQNIFKNENYTKSQLSYFISLFNWEKMNSYINKKIIDKSVPYNPWLLDIGKITERICKKDMSATDLNISSTFLLDISLLTSIQTNQPVLSSFIPENEIILATDKILIKQQCPLLIYTSKKTGILCTYYSINKISLEYILLPIYIRYI